MVVEKGVEVDGGEIFRGEIDRGHAKLEARRNQIRSSTNSNNDSLLQ